MEYEGNFLALAALIAWPFVTLAFFWRLRPTLALTASILGGVLLLPERIALADPPLLPPIDKQIVICLSVLCAALWRGRSLLFARTPGPGWKTYAVLLLAAALSTSYTNGEWLTFGRTLCPPFSFYDGVCLFIEDLIRVATPFFIARSFFRNEHDLRDILRLLVGCALVYSVLALIEVQLSPQFHRWVYGFHQHDFQQTLRFGGYRPMVFMQHGLALSVLMTTALLGAAALVKADDRIGRLPGTLMTAWLTLVVLACKSLGAILYAAIGAPIVLFWKGKPAVVLAIVVGAVALFYPLIRLNGLFPTEEIVAWANTYDEERAASLEFRLVNEDSLMERARERLFFGWGTYGRSRIYNEVGETISVTDGYWIILLGDRGFFGFFLLFGPLVIPIWVARRRFARVRDPANRVLLAALTLIVGIRALELIPNGLFSIIPYFTAGALTGVAQGQRSKRKKTERSRARALEDPS